MKERVSFEHIKELIRACEPKDMILEFQSRHIRKEFIAFVEAERPDIASCLDKVDSTPNLTFTNLNEDQSNWIRSKVSNVAKVSESPKKSSFQPFYKPTL